MDEEENQEGLANRKVSQGKVQRKLFILTDEEDSAEEAGSTSDESVGSRQVDEAEEERDEDGEDSDGCPEGEDSVRKGVEAASAGVPAQLLDLSSDDEAEKCPICLHSFQEQPVATPSGCQHHFCLDCILEWSKNVNSCPVDRIPFSSIQLRKCHGGKVQKTIPVQEPVKAEEEEINVDFDQTSCEVCGRRDREDRLLLCDGCDAGYHIECLTPPLDAVPVEEWFCPECTSNNPHTDSTEEVSEDEVAALLTDAIPTTSRLRTSSAGRTRTIARTRQSERVRATVNRNRITQARAIQHVPRYLIQSTWLDETISAVLNSSACARRGRTGEKHKKTQRKKGSTESSSSSSSKNRTAGKDLKVHRGHTRSTKLEQKQVVKKDPAHHSRITKGSTTGKPKQSPSTRPLGGHPKSRRASLSIYGDPLDLDPFDDESSAAGSPPLMDMNRRGLSHSALRSHQPVARPIQHGRSRGSISISEGDVVEDSAPVPDLLGSILSGQSLLLMDSTTMVINRDGSLKLGKPACESSSKTSISSHTNTYEFETEVQAGMASGSGLNGDPESFHSLPQIPSSSHSFPDPSSSSATPTSPLTPLIMPGNANVCSTNLAPEKPHKVYTPHPVNPVGMSQRSKTSTSSPSLPLRHSNSMSDWATREKGVGSGKGTGTVKQVPLKPLWLDVSRLPRIPKIRRGADSGTSLQGVAQDEQGRAEANKRQKQDRSGTSCTSSSSSSWTSALNPSSSSTGSFCISALRQTRCPTSPEGQVTSLGSAENQLSEMQSWNIQDRFHPIGSHLLGPEGVPEGETLDRHANGMMPEEKGVVPHISGCDSNNADCQTKPETIEAIRERNKYLGYGENMKMERLCPQNLPLEGQPTICNSRADVATKCRSHNMLSSQKQDTSLRSEKNKSKPKDQRSRSSSCSAPRGKSHPDRRGKLKDSHARSGGPDGSWRDTEPKRKSREMTGSCSHSKETKGVRSSPESSLSDSPERPRRRRHRWSHSNSGHPSRNRVPSERDEWRNRTGSESQEFPQPRSRSRTRSRDRRKDWVKTQSSCRSKYRSTSKDGKRPKSRSLSREKKNEKDSSHSSCSTKSSQRTNSSVSPTNMENYYEPVSLKYPKDLTDHVEMEQGKQFSSSVVSKLLKLRREKKASLCGVEEEISAFVFHDEKGKSRTRYKEKNKEKNKEKEKKGEKEIKPDLEKMTDTELIWVQSHIKSSCQSQIPSSVETDYKSAILPIRKKEQMTDSASSVSSQKLFVAKEEKSMKESLPATDPKKRPKEIFVECTKQLSMDYTLNSLDVRRPDKAEATGTACDKGRTVITDTPETVGDLEATMITDTPETVGDLETAMITDTPETVGDMKAAMITDIPETVGDMKAAMITDTPESVGDLEAAMITDTLETVGDMEVAMITDTSVTVSEMDGGMITESFKTVGNLGSSAITDTPETAGDMDAAVITDSSETVGDMESTVITEASENVGHMEGAVITDTPDTIGDSESTVITDASETTGDMESTAISDVPTIAGDVGDTKIMDKPVVKQEGHLALKPAVIMAFSAFSKRPVKRVTWSLQELDAPPAQPTRMLLPNTLSHGSKDGPEIPASPSQVQDMKKMHLQERAIEEVKLAIRPFFQKKEITKDEYKEIWGKAVQKICHCKSGEISPERVASLVKAYVEKYKFLKKQQKDRQSQELEGTL